MSAIRAKSAAGGKGWAATRAAYDGPSNMTPASR